MRIFHYFIILFAIFFLTHHPIFAQQNRWMFVGTDADGTAFYLDRTFRQPVNNGVRVWDKSVYPDGSYRISLVEWKCVGKKFFVVDVTIYTPTGSFIRGEKGTAWVNVTPDSTSEVIFKRVCEEVPEDTSKPTTSKKMMAEVIAEKVNVRAAPNVDSDIILQATGGERFVLIEQKPTGGWYQIFLPGIDETAWIHGNVIKLIKPSGKSNPGKAGARRRSRRQKFN